MQDISELTNRVFNEDISSLLRRIPDSSIDFIFGDPDYNVGLKYRGKSFTTSEREYNAWYSGLAAECFRVLKPSGNLMLLNYAKPNSYLRVNFLDTMFYEVHEYIWIYNINLGQTDYRLTPAHRNILHCRKSESSTFYKDSIAVPYENQSDRRIKKLIDSGSKGRMPYSWFYYDLVKNISKDKTFHSTQIPQGMISMLIKSCTVKGDLVLILFGGSGTEVCEAKALGRNYISAEIDPVYCKLINYRLETGMVPV